MLGARKAWSTRNNWGYCREFGRSSVRQALINGQPFYMMAYKPDLKHYIRNLVGLPNMFWISLGRGKLMFDLEEREIRRLGRHWISITPERTSRCFLLHAHGLMGMVRDAILASEDGTILIPKKYSTKYLLSVDDPDVAAEILKDVNAIAQKAGGYKRASPIMQEDLAQKVAYFRKRGAVRRMRDWERFTVPASKES